MDMWTAKQMFDAHQAILLLSSTDQMNVLPNLSVPVATICRMVLLVVM
jgi:hypothetical protein